MTFDRTTAPLHALLQQAEAERDAAEAERLAAHGAMTQLLQQDMFEPARLADSVARLKGVVAP